MKVIERGKYLGVNKNERCFNGILLSRTFYPQGLQSEWHYHENPYFTFVLAGGSVERRKEESVECAAGEVFFYNRQEPHKNLNYQEGSNNFNIELDTKWLKESGVEEKAISGSFFMQNPDTKLIILRAFKEYCLNDDCSSLSVEALTLQLLNSLAPRSSSIGFPPWLDQLSQLLNDRWSENFSLQELSLCLHVHPVTISRYFPKYFNCTMGEYIRKIRITKALALLRSTKMPLGAIAYECGFSDQSHFIRNFKEYTGFLPRPFRQV